MLEIKMALTEREIDLCFPTMAELRPHLKRVDFVDRIRSQQAQGFHLAYGISQMAICTVAGFRVVENLAIGQFLYVDDLVSSSTARGLGHGREMLLWLKVFAREKNCKALHLDSSVQRLDAHRFYRREGLEVVWLHFASNLNEQS